MSTQTQTACPKCAEPPERHRPSDGCPYNGWHNRDTWAVKLWIDNEEGTYKAWRDAARETLKSGAAAPTLTLAIWLREEHEEQALQACPGNNVYSDLLGSVMQDVDWEEIAGSLLAEVQE